VGIAESKIGASGVDLEITYTDKTGQRLYPHIYTISREKLSKCPVQIIKGYVRLRMVPIADLEIKREAVYA